MSAFPGSFTVALVFTSARTVGDILSEPEEAKKQQQRYIMSDHEIQLLELPYRLIFFFPWGKVTELLRSSQFNFTCGYTEQ